LLFEDRSEFGTDPLVENQLLSGTVMSSYLKTLLDEVYLFRGD